MTNMDKKIDDLVAKQAKMYPIVKDIMFVKGYGSFTWKVFRYIGIATLGVFAFGHKLKEFWHWIINHF